MVINLKIKAIFYEGTLSKKSMSKSTVCMFQRWYSIALIPYFFLHVSHSMVISKRELHIFDTEINKAHQQGDSYSSFPLIEINFIFL